MFLAMLQFVLHYTKCAIIRVFTDPYSPVYVYTGEYRSVKICILAYFTQCCFPSLKGYVYGSSRLELEYTRS